MINMSAKFDKETRNGVVSILFTSLFPYMSIVTIGQTDTRTHTHTDRRRTKWSLCAAMLRRRHKKEFILLRRFNNNVKYVTLTFDPWPGKLLDVVLLS